MIRYNVIRFLALQRENG